MEDLLPNSLNALLGVFVIFFFIFACQFGVLTFGLRNIPSEIKPKDHSTILEYEANYLGLWTFKGTYENIHYLPTSGIKYQYLPFKAINLRRI